MKRRYYILKLPANDPHWCCDVPTELNKKDLRNYVRVWTDEIEYKDITSALEKLFYIFNVNHPEHYAASSLSVGDIIAIRNMEENTEEFYGCSFIGWKHLKIKVEE